MSDNNQTIKTQLTSTATNSYDDLIKQIVETINNQLNQQMNLMFVNARHIIATLPNACGISKQACKDAFRSLRLSRANIISNYTHHIRKQLKPTTIAEISDSDSDILNEFIKQDEVDILLAMTAIYSKAISDSSEIIGQLETRLEYLEIASDNSFEKHAILPKQLCEVFCRAIKSSGVNQSHSIVILKLYEQTINANLGELYEALNIKLIAANVMPNIMMDSYEGDLEPKNTAGVQSRVATYYDPQNNKAADYIHRSDAEKNALAMRCMSGEMTVSDNALDLPESFKTTPSQYDMDGKNCYARTDVVTALSKMQQVLVNNDASVEIGGIKSLLFNSMPKQTGSSKRVNLLDERNMDFVGMMFDVIAEDEVVSELTKSLLLRLQISIIKVSITDKTLFINKHHPVRNVLNLITKIGQDINSKTDVEYKRIEAVISKLLKEYYTDIVSFKRAEKVLAAIVLEKEELSNNKELAQQKKIIRNHAKNVVLTELKCLSAGKVIPKVIQPLILKYLPTLMMNQYVRHGRDSAHWNTATDLLKRLIQCIQPLRKNNEWLYLKEHEAGLLHELTTTFYKTNQNKQKIHHVLLELKTLFEEMIIDFGFKGFKDEKITINLSDLIDDIDVQDADVLNDEKAIKGRLATSTKNQKLNASEQALDDSLNKALSVVNSLPAQVHPGVWFELYNGEEHAMRRLKLSVIINDSAKVIFCDRHGNTVMEKDASELIEELDANKSRVIADHSTFDNALGNVISNLVA